MTIAYVGLGSNQDRPPRQLARAVERLAAWPGVERVRTSRAWWSAPWGVEDQPEFLNAVLEIETSLSPEALLAGLLELEQHHGRDRSRERRWGPRTLDLDLLVYGDLEIDRPGLTVPHPRLADRAFVCVPLAELAPDLEIPGLGLVRRLAAAGDRKGLRPADLDLRTRTGPGFAPGPENAPENAPEKQGVGS